MSDIIRILPDSVANQIAAGEVIQRPASAVKELLENAIDAGADDIKLIIKDAGKTLIQVIDNGSGMSDTDARLSFERHATSKIREANDLFIIKSLGFRGEALASIASIAHVSMKTRLHSDELGTSIEMEGFELKEHISCSCEPGTSISVKNLFFNVPARRNFLKTDTAETSHIMDEFFRIAIAHPEISFSFHHNGKVVYILDKSNLKQRIVALYGKNYNERLLTVEQRSDQISIWGFIVKAEFAKKTRGEQFFFVNKRFIKQMYLNHAVENAFKDLIPEKAFPSYFLFIDVNPATIDVNIHPTKTEVSFQDAGFVYAILRSSVKKALGLFSLSPAIDFDTDVSTLAPPAPKNYIPSPPSIQLDPDYNPFKKSGSKPLPADPLKKGAANSKNWQELYKVIENNESDLKPEQKPFASSVGSEEEIDSSQTGDISEKNIFQIHNRYIITTIKSGLIIIDKFRAYERIMYEQMMDKSENKKFSIQQLLFPQVFDLAPADAVLMKDMLNDYKDLGFDINEFGVNTFIINGIPADLKDEDVKELVENMLENFKITTLFPKVDKRQQIIISMARHLSKRISKPMHNNEMLDIVDRLFACKIPYSSPSGKNIFKAVSLEELDKML